LLALRSKVCGNLYTSSESGLLHGMDSCRVDVCWFNRQSVGDIAIAVGCREQIEYSPLEIIMGGLRLVRLSAIVLNDRLPRGIYLRNGGIDEMCTRSDRSNRPQ
jgi:hypothetical protein